MVLVGWWKLDGNANDSSGYGNHGTANGVSWVNGKIGECGEFDGDDDYIELSSDVTNVLSGQTTISAWVYFDSDYTSRNCIFYARGDSTTLNTGNGSDNTDSFSNLNVQHRESNELRVFLPARSGVDLPSTGEQLSFDFNFDEWFFLTIVWDENNNYIAGFINGEKVAEDDNNTDLDLSDFRDFSNNSNFIIGNNGGGQPHKGYIDDVRIYNHALSPKEIKELSQAKVLHYKFDIESDTDAHDSSGNDNHGTVNGATWTSDSKIGSGCYSFDGEDDYIELDNSITLSKEAATFAWWMKPNSDDITIFCKKSGDYESLVDLISDGTRISAETDTNCNRFNFDGIPDARGTWKHYAIKFEDSLAYLYINGDYWGEATSYGRDQCGDDGVSVNEMVNDTTFKFIGMNNAYRSKFDGLMDDIRFYQEALSDSEIQEIYQQRASIDNKGNLYGHEIEEANEKLTIDEQTKDVYDNDYKSMGTWNVEDPDLSDFVETDNTLGNTIVEGWVFCSSIDYHLTTIEYTKENNTKGFKRSIPDPDDGWKVGWNYIKFDVSGYQDEDNTPWDDMDRIEFYRSGEDTGVDTSQYITIKNLKLRKFLDNEEIRFYIKEQGNVRNLHFSELGPMDGIVGYWTLDGDTKDYSGNNNHGTNNGATITSGLGQSAYEFDGTDDYIDCGNSDIFNNFSQITLSLWSYAFSNGWTQLLMRGDHKHWQLDFSSNGKFRFYASDTSTYDSHYSVYSDDDNLLDEWYHVVGTYDGDTMKLYINAVQQNDTESFPGFSDMPDADLNIGRNTGDSGYFEGKIQDVRIYNRALTSEEINILYNITHPDQKQRMIQSNTGIIYTKGQIQEF